jgi:hypothetical protein
MREAANKSPVNDATSVSEESWRDRVQKKIVDWVHAIIHKQQPAAAKDIAGLVPVVKPTAFPEGRTAFPEGRFVTLLSSVSIQTSPGKAITLHTGSNFALLAVENGQAVIRYYDGHKYSIPLSATDYR